MSPTTIVSEESCRLFSLSEIQSMTNYFDDAFVIGIGGFGKVYKGLIYDSGVVAVKRLNAESKQGANEFSAEIKMLSNLHHPNLVTLIGYCSDCEEKILVYEYIARGTLADHLYKRRQIENSACSSHLSWEKRLEICIGAAHGLDFIHTGTNQSFIHRDVKTTNILLDENWVVKISDFGLSKVIASHSITHLTTDVKGSFGYFDPDYFFTHRLTTKSDVYAFGVVLLEVLSGRPPVDATLEEEQISLILWAQQCIKKGKIDEIIDPSLGGKISQRCLNYFVKVANNCLQKDPKARPTMAEVVESLELALASQRKGEKYGIITKVLQRIALLPKGKDCRLREKKDDDYFKSRPIIDLPRESHPKSARHHKGAPRNYIYRAEEFSFSELVAATDNFSLANKIGAGSFGTVYRGILWDGREVAIKRRETGAKTKEFQEKVSAFDTELALLSRLHHKHQVSLVGYCKKRDKSLLVYEYMKNGALYDHLHGKNYAEMGSSALNSWKKRIKIALDAARGIEYLHHYAVPPVIHRDIKSSNILLDENWTARVSGFALSLTGSTDSDADFGPMDVVGTVGYIDPEYFRFRGNVLTTKSDVYGFGVVMLELLTGKRAIFRSSEIEGGHTSVVEFAALAILNSEMGKVLDRRVGLPEKSEAEAVEVVGYTAVDCVSLEGRLRPTMREIVATLERAVACIDSHGSISSGSE